MSFIIFEQIIQLIFVKYFEQSNVYKCFINAMYLQ